MAPPNEAVYANLMLAVRLDSQRRLDDVLDMPLSASDLHCTSPGYRADDVAPCRGKVWAQMTGTALSLGGSGFDANGANLLLGTDGQLGEVAHLGVEAGASWIHSDRAYGGRSRARGVHAGVYAFGNVGQMVLSGTVDALHDRYRVYRETGIGGAAADPTGRTLSAGLQAAWPMTWGQSQLTPKLGVLYQHQVLHGFDEHVASTNPLASSFGVNGTHGTATSLQPYAGVEFAGSFTSGSVTYIPQVEVGYRYDTRDNAKGVPVTAADGTPFLLRGTQVGHGMAEAGVKLSAQVGGSWSWYVDYHGLFGNHLTGNSVSVGFLKQF